MLRSSPLCAALTVAATFLAACADDAGGPDGADGASDLGADAGEGSGQDADAGADAPDAAAPDATATATRDGDWVVGMEVAELGGLALPLQFTLSGVTEATIAEISLRAIDDDGTVSDVIGSESNVALDGDAFVFDPGLITLPAAFSPIGADVPVQVRFEGAFVDDGFFCGDARGLIPGFAVALEASTFGGIPWAEREGVTLPTSCDWTPEPVVERVVVSIGPEDRPAELELPTDFEDRDAWPILVVLHGRQATGDAQAQLFALRELQDELGYLLVVPDGTRDSDGDTFWNATPACCDSEGTGVDDLGWLLGLIDEVVADHRGDADDVTLMGHSNGGFMAHRMACDASDRIRGIISLAGSTFLDEERCTPDQPVSVLNIHGTADGTVPYDGSAAPGFAFPSAAETTARWVEANGCEPLTSDGERDYLDTVDGDETAIEATEACNGSAVVALWTVNGGGHIPPFNAEALTRDALTFLRSRIP